MTEGQFRLLERNKKIAALYLKGATLERAGAPFGLKRERVRQILLKQGIVERRFWSKPQPTLEEKRKIKELKFWSRVALTADPNRCWEWQGYVDRAGYGKSSWYGKSLYTQHLSWEIYYGKTPMRFLLNDCGNRKCVNVTHYRESADKARKSVLSI